MFIVYDLCKCVNKSSDKSCFPKAKINICSELKAKILAQRMVQCGLDHW